MGVYVNNHVVYGDCEMILREHWSWDGHGYRGTIKNKSCTGIGGCGVCNNCLTSYSLRPGGHGRCKVRAYDGTHYKGGSHTLFDGEVPANGFDSGHGIPSRRCRPECSKDIPGGFQNAASSIHLDNGYMYYFDANGRTLRQWSKDAKKLATQACGKNMYEQALFGVSDCLPKDRPSFASNSNSRQYRPGDTRSTAFCAQVKNMPVIVDENTQETCYDKLSSAALKKSKGIAFCKKDPTHARCKCINVARTDFIQHCKKNRTLPGCKEVVEGIKEFEDAGLMSATGLFGNPDCIVPSICSGDVYEPTTGMPACANKLAICNQILELDNIKAAAGVKAAQACNINFDAEQKKKDDAKQAAKDKAANDKAQAAKDKAQAAEEREQLIAAAVAAAKEENKFKVPETVFGYSTSDEENQKKALGGVGGVSFVSVSCCCLMIVLLAG